MPQHETVVSWESEKRPLSLKEISNQSFSPHTNILGIHLCKYIPSPWIYSSFVCSQSRIDELCISFLTPITVYSCFDDIQESLRTRYQFPTELVSSSAVWVAVATAARMVEGTFWQYAFPLSSLDADISVTVFYSLTHRLKKPVPFFSGLFETMRTTTPQGSSLKVTMCCVQR